MTNRNLLKWLFGVTSLTVFLTSVQSSVAQPKQRYTNLQQALASSGQLSGASGPRSVNWIEGGSKFSFIDGPGIIKSFSPGVNSSRDQKEDVVFDGTQLKFPTTDKPFTYSSFQWSKDSKNILFQSNFRPVYRRSGVSDYYVYSLADKSLKLVAKGAQTAELAPDGSKVGYERGGNMYVF